MNRQKDDIPRAYAQQGKPAAKLIIPAVTPSTHHSSIDESSLDAYITHLLSKGAHTLFFLTEVGEGSKIRTPVKEKLIERVYHTKRIDRWPNFVVDTTGGDIQHTIELTEHASQAGASAVLIHPLAIYIHHGGVIDLPAYHTQLDPLWRKMTGMKIILYTDDVTGAKRLLSPAWIREWIEKAEIEGIYAHCPNRSYLEDLVAVGDTLRNEGRPFEIYAPEWLGNEVITPHATAPYVEGIVSSTANLDMDIFTEWLACPEDAKWLRIEKHASNIFHELESRAMQITFAKQYHRKRITIDLTKVYISLLKERLHQSGVLSTDRLF